MDLAAFLEPGLYPVFLLDSDGGFEPWGHLLRRPGRAATFLASARRQADEALLLSVVLPGFRLLPDGSLRPARGATAPICLAGAVSSCRVWAEKELFVLKLKNLARVID
ncbi:MAG: hypothetical protein LBO66_00415 [Deltaproteobacteria bacterium]|jgi:hypothetical protein|nr:hypothetical protein [Deltaproteobacteria bacterium]